MKSAALYVDTSATAKWYLPEPFSEAVEALLTDAGRIFISRFVSVAFRGLHQRANSRIHDRFAPCQERLTSLIIPHANHHFALYTAPRHGHPDEHRHGKLAPTPSHQCR